MANLKHDLFLIIHIASQRQNVSLAKLWSVTSVICFSIRTGLSSIVRQELVKSYALGNIMGSYWQKKSLYRRDRYDGKKYKEKSISGTRLSLLSDSTGRIYYQHTIWLSGHSYSAFGYHYWWANNLERILSPNIRSNNKGAISNNGARIWARRISKSHKGTIHKVPSVC